MVEIIYEFDDISQQFVTISFDDINFTSLEYQTDTFMLDEAYDEISYTLAINNIIFFNIEEVPQDTVTFI